VDELDGALRIQNFKYEELKIAFANQVLLTEERDTEIIQIKEATDKNDK
jgi:hypothetical protein